MIWIAGAADLSIPWLKAAHAVWNIGATTGANGIAPALSIAAGTGGAVAAAATDASSAPAGDGGFVDGDGGSAAGGGDDSEAPDPAWRNDPDSMDTTTTRLSGFKAPPGGFQRNPSYQGADGANPGSTVSNVDGYNPTQTVSNVDGYSPTQADPHVDGARTPDGPLRSTVSPGDQAPAGIRIGPGSGDGSQGGDVGGDRAGDDGTSDAAGGSDDTTGYADSGGHDITHTREPGAVDSAEQGPAPGPTDDLIKTTQYDNDGHVTGSRVEYTDPDDGTRWEINRDASGNMVSEQLTARDGSTKTVDPVDANGDRLRTDRDANGQVTRQCPVDLVGWGVGARF